MPPITVHSECVSKLRNTVSGQQNSQKTDPFRRSPGRFSVAPKVGSSYATDFFIGRLFVNLVDAKRKISMLRIAFVCCSVLSLACSTTSASDPAPVDSEMPDAGSVEIDASSVPENPDASVSSVDAGTVPTSGYNCEPSGDYVEMTEENDISLGQSPESTNQHISVSDESFTIGGCVNETEIFDWDYYTFTVDGDAPIHIDITVTIEEQSAIGGVEVALLNQEQTPLIYGYGKRNARLFATLEPGQYILEVNGWIDLFNGSLSYEIGVSEDKNSCPITESSAPDYTEKNDGSENTGNDVFTFYPLTKTISSEDNPENTELTLNAEKSYSLQGVSAAIENMVDFSLDRDTFSLTTGPTTNAIKVRLNWPNGEEADERDMDFFIIDPTDDTIVGESTRWGLDDEVAEFTVQPESLYLLVFVRNQLTAPPLPGDPMSEEPPASNESLPYNVSFCPL